ncbi:MAG: S1 RNA-binding domain-containing protein, partial [Bacteroidales bacterium]|nr:S1 RNA-binding domain-containing protein [Bacteroidales bacterium]
MVCPRDELPVQFVDWTAVLVGCQTIEVEGVVYQISRNFGAFVAVDSKYSGLIPAREFNGEVKPGDVIRARVSG